MYFFHHKSKENKNTRTEKQNNEHKEKPKNSRINETNHIKRILIHLTAKECQESVDYSLYRTNKIKTLEDLLDSTSFHLFNSAGSRLFSLREG